MEKYYENIRKKKMKEKRKIFEKEGQRGKKNSQNVERGIKAKVKKM